MRITANHVAIRELALDAGMTPVSGGRFVCGMDDLEDLVELIRDRVMEAIIQKVECTEFHKL